MPASKSLFRYVFHGTSLARSEVFLPQLNAIGLDKNCDWPTYQGGERMNEGSTACYKIPVPDQPWHAYFKRYSVAGEPWRFFLRKSKAACETINYFHLNQLGIPTLEVMACYERRILGRLEWACIVTREVENTEQLGEFVQNTWAQLPTAEKKAVFESIKNQLMDQLRRAHAAKFFHLDLKWRNVLIQKTDNGYRPVWIDCPRGRFMRWRPDKGLVADLSALARLAISHFSRSQQMKLLYDYLGPDANRVRAHSLFRNISRHLSRRPPKALLE